MPATSFSPDDRWIVSNVPGPNRIGKYYQRPGRPAGGPWKLPPKESPASGLPPDSTGPSPGRKLGPRSLGEEQVFPAAAEVHRAIRHECVRMAMGLALVLGGVPLALFAAASWLSAWWGLSLTLTATLVAGMSIVAGAVVVAMAAWGAARVAESFAESILYLRLKILAMQQQVRQSDPVDS